ncbi:hypothetical protein FE783_34155 [Paenibacillus mesophilus]|uniref:hypothetical protein n=1 Tax=Paenibacillus mesophilus TaxID=2582849 RepID=UPI00110D29EB|nr:hypothetical protein [Paenibacillus mesophilus]TMV43813.1 hypothetical protein FE783_34155 [Paenibacillus mesophilus]
MKGEQLKKQYCYPNLSNMAFIAVEDDTIVAFMGVISSKVTTNGHIECGFLVGYESKLDELLIKCVAFARERGGHKIYKFTSTKFGQVRNKEIALWERLGFTSDEYALITTTLDLRKWKESEDFDASGIESAIELDYDNILRIFIEDGEHEMAELFQNQYSPTKNPDRVVLTLRDKATNEIAGIAYYRVVLCNKGTKNEFFDASAFGLHIRPEFLLNRHEIRRFLQGSLISMKQLNLYHVITRITLKNFRVFAAMVTEGFHNEHLESANVLRLYRNI